MAAIEKLIVAQLVSKFSAFCASRFFPLHCSLEPFECSLHVYVLLHYPH